MVVRERAELLDVEELLLDPFAGRFSETRSRIVERLAAEDPATLQRIIKQALNSSDVGVIGSTREAMRWRELAPG